MTSGGKNYINFLRTNWPVF